MHAPSMCFFYSKWKKILKDEIKNKNILLKKWQKRQELIGVNLLNPRFKSCILLDLTMFFFQNYF
jgi:hypothetical protein